MKTYPPVHIVLKRAKHWALATLSVASALLFYPSLLQAKEWWVDGSVQTSGNGSQASPYKTINEAITASGSSDTVTILSGTYREAVLPKSGTGGAPYILRSGSNARVIVTGFWPLPAAQNWTVYSSNTSGTVYVTTADWKVRDLFVGNGKQMLSRIPAKGQPKAVVQSYANNTITLTSDLGVTLASAGSAFVYLYSVSGNVYYSYPIASIAGNVITLTGTNTKTIAANDTLLVANHPSFCQSTGEWAYIDNGNSTTQVYYRADGLDALNSLQSRKIGQPVCVSIKSNVLIDGLEVSGATQLGIRVASSSNVTIQNCIIYNNGIPGAGYGSAGVLADSCTNVTLQNSLLCGNVYGVMANRVNLNYSGTANGLTIQNCEVAYSQGDCIDIAGTGSYAIRQIRSSSSVTCTTPARIITRITSCSITM